MTSTEGEALSPKGVADLQVVVEKIRDRREAVLDGRVMPSTTPNFPVRRSLVSCDDEEVQTYHIEITTDNVVKQSVPARFSSSEKEEYLAEFDMVNTEGEYMPPPATPRRRASKMQQDVSETKQEQQPKKKADPPNKAFGGVFSSLRKRTYSLERAYPLEESKSGVEVKMPGSAKAKDNVTPQKEKKTVRDIVVPPSTTKAVATARSSTPPQKKSGGMFSSLRKRTYSLEDSKHGIEVKMPGSSLTKTNSKDQAAPVAVSAATAPPTATKPVEASQPTRHEDGPVDLDAEVAEEENDAKDSPSTKTNASTQKQKKGETAAQEAKAVPDEAKPATETKATPVLIPPPVLTKLPEAAPPRTTDTTSKVEVLEPNPAEPIELEPPDTSKPKSTTKDDDTKSTASSSTEAIMATRPRDKFYGEAAVERILEKFFDKVTCSCINSQCVGKEPAESDVPEYMVVEIQKIHEKAQRKRSEIVEKRHARKAKKSKEESSSSRKMKGSVASKRSSKSKRDKSAKKEFEMNAEKKGVPTYQWGEKVLEEDSVTTASSAPPPTSGVTVGQFFKKRFDLFEKSIRRGENEVSADGSSHGVETLVEDSDVDEDDTLEDFPDGAILNIRPVERDVPSSKSAAVPGAMQSITVKKGSQKSPEERVILLAPADEDGTESLLDAADEDGESLLDDEESEYTTELIQVDFDPSKLGSKTDADMYLAREVLRRYAEITGISLDELIEDVVDESLASVTLDAYGFPLDRNGDDSTL